MCVQFYFSCARLIVCIFCCRIVMLNGTKTISFALYAIRFECSFNEKTNVFFFLSLFFSLIHCCCCCFLLVWISTLKRFHKQFDQFVSHDKRIKYNINKSSRNLLKNKIIFFLFISFHAQNKRTIKNKLSFKWWKKDNSPSNRINC